MRTKVVGRQRPAVRSRREVLHGTPGRDSRRQSVQTGQRRAGAVFVAPALLLFFAFTLLPVLFALWISFTNEDLFGGRRWVGLANYERMPHDSAFVASLRNILVFSALHVPAMVALSLALAVALNRPRHIARILRTVYFLPVITSSVAAATVWTWLLNDDFGLVNGLLRSIGIDAPAWLADSDTALLAIVLVTLWQGLGGNMLIYLAGLQGVPMHLEEAAAVDGATRWQAFRHVVLPCLRPTTFFVVTLSLISAFQLFDQAYVMTQGGPGYATRTPVFQIYQSGFGRLQMGYASAQAFVLFMIIVFVTVINVRVNRRRITAPDSAEVTS